MCALRSTLRSTLATTSVTPSHARYRLGGDDARDDDDDDDQGLAPIRVDRESSRRTSRDDGSRGWNGASLGNQSSSTSTGSRARFALVATFAQTRARASLTLARLHARRAGDLGRRRALRSTDFIHNSPPRRAQNSSEFEAPNQYGYFPSAIEAAKQKRATQQGFNTQVKMTKEEQQARFKGLCAKHPELQKCQSDYVSPLRVKPSTQSVINGSVVRSDGIILVPGNKEDLITWALDPAMSGDTLGLLLPTVFIIIGAQLKQVAGVPEYVSGAVGVTTKLLATALVALYWVPSFVQ